MLENLLTLPISYLVVLDVVCVVLGLALVWYVSRTSRTNPRATLLILGFSVFNLGLMILKLLPPAPWLWGAAVNLAVVVGTKVILYRRIKTAGAPARVGPFVLPVFASRAPLLSPSVSERPPTNGEADGDLEATVTMPAKETPVVEETKQEEALPPPADANYTQLLHLMEEERIYLNTDLLQRDVAKQLGVSSRTLSRVLRRSANTNFNGFINRYRIREARRLLTDPEFAHLTTEAIGTQAGFNSRVTFYRAFREETGRSPAKYRSAALSGKED